MPRSCFWVVLLGACTGVIGDDAPIQEYDPPPIPEALRCDGSEPEHRVADPLKRLTRREYLASLQMLLTHFAPDGGDVLFATATSIADRLPLDQNLTVEGGPEAQDQLYGVHVSAYVDVADAIGALVDADESLRAAFGGACAATAPIDDACARAMVAGVGLWALRRPLSTEEVTRFSEFALLEESGQVRRALSVLLVQPEFLYHVEVDGAPSATEDYLELTDYELASRLSFYFWRAMPDAELFAAAERGEIRENLDEWIEYARSRDALTRPVLREFVHQWLSLDEMPPVNLSESSLRGDPRFAAVMAELGLDEDSAAAFDAAMKDELITLVEQSVLDEDGTLAELFETDRVFSDDSVLSAIYGAPVRGDDGELHLQNRSGILSRAGFLFTGTGESHPIQRGNAVWERLFCTHMELPDDLPPGSTDLPEPREGMTTREQLEIKTSDVICSGCHTQINPVGFALEPYDALGRFREFETLYSDDTLEVLSEPRIDASVVLPPRLGGEVVDGAAGLSRAVASSTLAADCFAQRYFAFARRRAARPAEDEPLLCAISQGAIATGDAERGGLRSMIANVARLPEFQRHYLESAEMDGVQP